MANPTPKSKENSVSCVYMPIRILPFVFPLLLIVFLPFFQDFYDTGRWVVMIIATLFLSLIYGIRVIQTKKIHLAISPVSIGFGALTIAAMVSLLTASTNKIEALVHPLGAVTYACLFFISLLLPHMLTKEQKNHMQWTIISITGLVGLICIYQQFAITSMLFPQATYLKSNLWNPTGTPVSALYLFTLVLPLVIQKIRISFLAHKEKLAAAGIVSAIFIIAGFGITLWRFIPMISTVLMPIPIGWTTLLEALKSGKTALVGVGAENFLSAYAIGRPISINQTALWNTGFSTSATLLLHTATTLGLAGLTAFVVFLITWLSRLPKTVELKIIWIVAAVFIILFPPSIPLLILMALFSVTEEQPKETHQSIPKTVAIGIVVCLLIIVTALSVQLFHFVKGEMLYATASRAVETENNLTKAYTNYILAIKQNQYMTRYHVSLSQLSLVMGGSILATAPKNETTGVVTLLDEDKSLVTSLFSLAVSEAKLATTLAPSSYVTWTNLATVYQSLIGVANDANTWTIAAYQKAISLNPISPNLRIDFGGIYMNAKDYDQAISQFMAAITLKPNYANAYYNLANAYSMKGETGLALDALQKTQGLLPVNGTEYTKVADEMKALKTNTPASNAASQQPTPTPVLQKPAVPTPIPLIP